LNLDILVMTMKCPICDAMMIWINGSISHDPPVKYYICENCKIEVTKYSETNYEIFEKQAN